MAFTETHDSRILITSALPYVNNVPHLGTLVCVLSANVYDRFCKLREKNVLSVLGTDENGTTTETKAHELGISPKECVDRFFAIHQKVYTWFGCVFDCFGRTSSKTNHEVSQQIFLKLHQNGYILEQEIEQLYSEKEGRFLADRFVEGTCPHCGYEKARGDQCDQCGKLLNAPDLINPVSKISGDKPIIKKTKHLFIDLPKLQPKLESWVAQAKKHWTDNARTTTESWLKEGLKPRAITRDIKWGIPVPLKGYEEKVFYSWFDAPIGYLSITRECQPNHWDEWWKHPKTSLVQFMGKDNIPFHTILFPAFLLGTGEPYALVDRLSVNEYLNYESGKFSKSLNQGVFCDDAMKTGIPPDVWRYYLMINHPDTHDSLFSWDNFQERVNNELVANVGNLVHRTLHFVNRYYQDAVPDRVYPFSYEEEVKTIEQLYEQIKLKDALKAILHLSKKANTYFQEQEPWKNITANKEKADNAIANLVNFIKDLAILIEPILPNTAASIRQQLNLEQRLLWKDLLKKTILQGHKINKASILFNKLEDDQVQQWKQQFGTKEARIQKSANDDKNDVVDIALLDLKVAFVLKVEDHPNADKLYKLQIDLGSEQRQICAGLKQEYTKEELQGKKLVVLANLAPTKLRGELSQGMLMAVESEDDCGVLTVINAKPGDPVSVEGYASGSKQITFKDFQKITLESKGGKVFYKGKPLLAGNEEVIVDKELSGRVC